MVAKIRPSVPSDCSVRLFRPSVPPECSVRVLRPSVPSECPGFSQIKGGHPQVSPVVNLRPQARGARGDGSEGVGRRKGGVEESRSRAGEEKEGRRRGEEGFCRFRLSLCLLHSCLQQHAHLLASGFISVLVQEAQHRSIHAPMRTLAPPNSTQLYSNSHSQCYRCGGGI